MNRNILVVAAHPDDELLGCAGTIAWHVNRGDKVHILIIAEGATSRADTEVNQNLENELVNLKTSAEQASRILGSDSLSFAGLPDNKLDTIPLLDIVKIIEKKSKAISPEIVYTHHSGDLNIDHKLVSQAVLTAFRPQPSSTVKNIYAFETVSSTEWGNDPQIFVPTRFVNITNFLDKKREALLCYSNEMRQFPHVRSLEAVEALAKFRGASVGLEAAEAFIVIREVIR